MRQSRPYHYRNRVIVRKDFRSLTGKFPRNTLHENSALLGCYSASSGNLLPTFRDKLSVPSSEVKNPNKRACKWKDY